jgi:hypothetical protein
LLLEPVLPADPPPLYFLVNRFCILAVILCQMTDTITSCSLFFFWR